MFVISRIIEVEVGVINRTLTETSIILDITKTECNNCFIIHWTEILKSCFCFSTDGKQHKARKLDMITLRYHAPRSYMTCPWHDYCIICCYDVTGADFENSPHAFSQSKEIASSMYNNHSYCMHATYKALCKCEIKAWNRIKARTGFEPISTAAIPAHCSTSWAIKSSGSRASLFWSFPAV